MDDPNKKWQPPEPPANLPMESSPPFPPPPPEITVRTMKSDMDALKQTGGANPSPKPFALPELTEKIPSPKPYSPLPPPPLPSVATPKMMPTETEKTEKFEQEKPTVTIAEEGGGWIKKIAVWSGILLVAAGIGFFGYFVLFPKLFPTQSPPPPIVTLPETTETSIATAPETMPEETLPAVNPHQSFLFASDTIAQKDLIKVDLLSLVGAFKEEAEKNLPNGSLSEIIFNNSNGQIPSSAVLSSLLPEFSAEKIKDIFEDDFTAALYYDENGAWPLYIFKINFNSSIVEAQNEIRALETSKNLSNLFVESPGAATSDFKNGQANGTATRYKTFSQKSAALNYSWLDDKLIISASYDGIKKVLP
ncbi:MAG: hypothetical protein A3B92_04185 [Candidatus Harrisonbacteria bacterium RIFCSPHIGHO2_02_FULL_42_16]|uniref:Uncharacterized protein n=1 Tax=Candidatus Harrisonbacteria bacterium RIFCSPHIGHO2_02_FULL_42_16 TaxID=1798404 RepID=A0A1G1ZJ80_9BACT|nr:MAG: hypothetical protein A3B92_04185 [Candidatus Harrisonbacteria bacterium RIFCSPHIGHO2_02_FULL_42_16]